MRFEKNPTSVQQQVSLLRERGMRIDDAASAERCLEAIGYYRLSAYWLPFEEPPTSGLTRSKRFRTGTTFSQIHDRYIFDRKLRLLVLEALERIEVHVRSRWTYHIAHAYGSHPYLQQELFSGEAHLEQLLRLAKAASKSDETFIAHYRKKYDEPELPPLWAATELMSFGELSKWVAITKKGAIKTAVAKDIGLPAKETMDGVLQAFSYARNICAHHSRLWNKRLVKRVPRVRLWDDDLVFKNVAGQKHPENTVYNLLVALMHLMHHQSTDSTLKRRMIELVGMCSVQEQNMMGFPPNWRSRPVWQVEA